MNDAKGKFLMKSRRLLHLLSTLLLALMASNVVAKTTFSGILQAGIINADDETSFVEEGTGRLIHDESGLSLNQAFIVINSDITDNISAQIVANHTLTPESSTGLTQAFLSYKPVPFMGYNWQVRGGMFYPSLSFENVDIGWTSPFAYTNSAINTWIGEEIRINGLELKLTRKGKHFNNSPHSFSGIAGIYTRNDTAGTILAWRGFSLHDKQTQLNESLPFANYPSIQVAPLDEQENHVEVFREEDGRPGYYLGAHWDYQRLSKVRYYYYDNQADPLDVSDGQYAWRTKFHSLSWLYRPIKNVRFIAQYLTGSTLMGPNAVHLNYEAFFILSSYKSGKHRFTARIDKFGTYNKNDILPDDDNASNGKAFTIGWRYNIDKYWQVGAEWLSTKSTQESREQLGLDNDLDQNQLMAILQYRYK